MMLKLNVILIRYLFVACICLTGNGSKAQDPKNNPESGKIRIASCQFPVSSEIKENLNWIREQMIESNLKKADIVHFPECALSGYPGADMNSLEQLNWDELHNATDSIMKLAGELKGVFIR